MKKIYFYLFFFALSIHSSAPQKLSIASLHKTSHVFLVYGAKGLSVGSEDLNFIVNLEKRIQQNSSLIVKKAAKCAAEFLKNNALARELARPIAYLEGKSAGSKKNSGYLEKSLGKALAHYIIIIHQQIKKATKQQREHFVLQLKKYPLSDYLNVWNSPNISLHSTKNIVRAQGGFAGMLIDMAAMMLPQLATQQSLQWVNSQDSVLYSVLSQASTTLSADFSTFQNSISTFEQQNLNAIITSFSQAQTSIANETTQAQNDAQAEITYLSSMTSLDVPQSKLLMSTLTFDAAFEQANMFTPAGPTWRNINFVGDWEFDPATKSFWQYNLIDSTKSGSTSAAANNYIFTEFLTNNSSYEIDCDITPYAVSYPFYAGILFNKARWISGDTSGLQKYRTIGIYGASKSDIGIYYAEQYYDTETDFFSSDATTVHRPLSQIFAGTAQKIGTVDVADFNTLSSTDLTYSFQITTSADTVVVTFGKKGEATTTETITSKSPTSFVYHGLGFISPGAAAQYALNKPTSILFSDSAIESFNQEIATLSSTN